MKPAADPDPFAGPFTIQLGVFQPDEQGEERGDVHMLGGIPHELLISNGLVYLITLSERRQLVGRVGPVMIRNGQRRRAVQLKSPLFQGALRAHLISPVDSDISEMLWLGHHHHHPPPRHAPAVKLAKA